MGIRRIDAAAGLTSKQSPSLSTIRIPSSTFWKIDENSQSVSRKARSASRCSLQRCRNEKMFRNIAKLKAPRSQRTKVAAKVGLQLYAKKDTERSPIDASKVTMEQRRSQVGNGWQSMSDDCVSDGTFIGRKIKFQRPSTWQSTRRRHALLF